MKEESGSEELLHKLSPKKMANILHDPLKTAKAVNLVYITDVDTPRISRQKSGKNFNYFLEGKEIKNKDVLERINKLVIPPAWENVWICALENGHLQATGIDIKKRKQYRYHPAWIALRNHSKYYRMIQFAHALPQIRLHIEKDLARKGLPQEKVLAAVVSLMERTHIRVGNNIYEKLYGSFGLTTFQDKHVDIKGNTIKLSFKGKKGVYHDIQLKNPKLSRIVQRCKEIPGKELFQYDDGYGQRHPIDSGMVNDYIREIAGENYTSKDFRTWAGTVSAFLALKELGCAETPADQKKKMAEAIDKVAAKLGNTRNVCKKYYVHPLILSLYENGTLQKYFDQLDEIERNDNQTDLTSEEKIILDILEKGMSFQYC